ncbi:MAG: acetyl-CoA C-acyltransferase, partial [Defluviitaleaceae bacterium]|nr:acetyl-CoA C-acyltransferase [Defluviitaleaceae bacterium]
MRNVVVVSAARTPIGSFLGCFADFSAVSLGAAAGAAAIERAGISPSDIDEVIFGNVLSAGLGQNVARQISVKLGVPNEVPSFVVNQVCGSGLKAVALGSRAIACGDAEIILAGGTENMSQAPFVQKNIRGGHKMGNIELVDTLIADGLTDVFNNYHMGITAENLVEKFGISREEQDEYAANSQQKAQKAIAEGKFAAEIAPVSIPQRRGEPVVIDKDEYPRAGVSAESLAKLRPTFRPDGTVTAANSSGINDGAAVVVLMSEEKAKTLGLKPMATIISSAVSGVEPSIMGIGPAPATQKALQKAGFALSAID